MKRVVRFTQFWLLLGPVTTTGMYVAGYFISNGRPEPELPKFIREIQLVSGITELLWFVWPITLAVLLQFLLWLSQYLQLKNSLGQGGIEIHLPRIPSLLLTALQPLLLIAGVASLAANFFVAFGPIMNNGHLPDDALLSLLWVIGERILHLGSVFAGIVLLELVKRIQQSY